MVPPLAQNVGASRDESRGDSDGDVARALSRQRARAAERLWTGGHRAEAIALARAALEAIAAVGDGAGAPWRTAVVAQLASAPSPRLDHEVTADDDAWFAAAQSARGAADRALSRSATAPSDARAARRIAIVLAALVVLLLGLALVVVRTRTTYRALASATNANGNGYPAQFAIDDDPATEWILPDGRTGYLDVVPSRPIHLTAVRIVNAHNAPWNNVAVHDWHLEAYRGDRVVATAHGSFPRLDPSPASIRVRLEADGVTDVRLVVDSFHGAAGGVAEVYLE